VRNPRNREQSEDSQNFDGLYDKPPTRVRDNARRDNRTTTTTLASSRKRIESNEREIKARSNSKNPRGTEQVNIKLGQTPRGGAKDVKQNDKVKGT